MPEPKPKPPDMLSDSWTLSDAELRQQSGRRRREEPPPPDTEGASLTLAGAQQRLQAKVQELANADRKTLANLTIEIQQLRVVCMLLAEAEAGNRTFDPNTYREMSMLNRMLATGSGDADDPDAMGALDDLRLEEEAAQRLAKRGITPDGAARLARVLGAAISRADAKSAPPDDDEGDEPDMQETQH